MFSLTKKQITYLRSLAQSLSPQLHVGHLGYSEGVLSSLADLFRGRELVKVRVLNNSEEDTKDLAARMAQDANALAIGVVGKTFTLYRPNPQLKQRIEFPE